MGQGEAEMARFFRLERCHARRFSLWLQLRGGNNRAAIRRDPQGERFAIRQRFASAPEDLLADDAVQLSIREHPRGQNDIRAAVGLIHDEVSDARSFHGSWILSE